MASGKRLPGGKESKPQKGNGSRGQALSGKFAKLAALRQLRVRGVVCMDCMQTPLMGEEFPDRQGFC